MQLIIDTRTQKLVPTIFIRPASNCEIQTTRSAHFQTLIRKNTLNTNQASVQYLQGKYGPSIDLTLTISGQTFKYLTHSQISHK